MEIQSATPPEFSHHLGPFVQKVDKILKECGVERQAYFGGTFIGNHVHKCCKVNYVKWMNLQQASYMDCQVVNHTKMLLFRLQL